MLRELLLSKLTREKLDEFIAANASNSYTLDLGCAHSPYSKHFPNRVGVDVYKAPGVDVVADAHKLPFPDETFEKILCTEVLEHLHTPELALSEMYRVLKKGGTLILTTRFVFPIHDAPGDYFRYTKYGLQHLFRNWHEARIIADSTTAETLGILIQRISLQTDLRGGKVTKMMFLLIARVIPIVGRLIRKEYGIRNPLGTRQETEIMSSGYYVLATK